MRGRPGLRVLLQGHTDRRGTRYRNGPLSEARAENAAQVLVDAGIARNRIDTEGVGESQPVDGRDNERARRRNRRVEVIWR